MNPDFNMLTYENQSRNEMDCNLFLYDMFSLQKVYKNSYEKNRGFSINYCETPKFQMDTVLKQFTDVRITLKSTHGLFNLLLMLLLQLQK